MSTELTTAVDNQQRALAVAEQTADESPAWRAVLRQAEKLAAAPLTPVHLKVLPTALKHIGDERERRRVAWQQTVANCILVANQAERWKADLFAVAAETYVVGNKLGYQGKLIAAVINSRGGLSAPLQVVYSTGKGDSLAAVIYGKRDGDVPDEAYEHLEAYADNEDRGALRKLARLGVLAIRVSVGQAKTKNEMWHKDPEQKLWYTGATKWARRFAPELMLGILTNDDLDLMREREAKEQPQATSRIGMVIPASLDASGVLPPEPANIDHGPAEPMPDSAPDEDPPVTGPAPEEATEPDPGPPDAEVIAQQFREMLEAADSLGEVLKIEASFAAHEKLDEDQIRALAEAANQRRAAIKGARGTASNGGKTQKPLV